MVEEEEEEDEDVTSTPVPETPVPATTPVPEPVQEPVPGPVPEQVKVQEPVPTPAPAPGSSPVSDPVPAPTLRRSSREKTVPDRLELTTKGKTFAAAVVYGLRTIGVGGGKKDVSERDIRHGHVGHTGHRHFRGHPLKVASPISQSM